MNKVNLTLVGLVVALAAALGLLGKMAWDKRELGIANSALNKQLMESKLEIGRAHTQFGNAQAYADSLEKALEDEINARNAEITRYGELVAKYEAMKKSKGKGKVIYVQGPKTKGDKFETGMLYAAIDDRTLVPVEQVGAKYQDFRLDAQCLFLPKPGMADSIPFEFSYNLHLTYAGELVETITPSGAINHYFNMWELDDKGKRVGKLEITDYNVVIDDQTAPHFHWWAPHLDIGILLGFKGTGKFSTGGSLGMSFMGYGLTKNDLAWRFPRISMDLAGSAGVGLTPVLYNMGEFIPIISNLWIGPHFTYMLNDRREWMLGFMIGGVL